MGGGRGLWGERGGSHEQNGVNFYLLGFLVESRKVKAVLSFRDFLLKEIPLCVREQQLVRGKLCYGIYLCRTASMWESRIDGWMGVKRRRRRRESNDGLLPISWEN